MPATDKSALIFRALYFFALAVIATGLPLSKFLMSAGQLILSGIWVCDAIYHQFVYGSEHRDSFVSRIIKPASNPLIWLWLAFYIYLAISLLWSTNTDYGLHDLKVKAPLFVLPFILGTMPALPRKLYHSLFYLFCGALITSALWGLFHHLVISPGEDFNDGRILSRFVSHIRLGLMMALACIWLIFKTIKSKSMPRRIGHIAALAFLLFFIIYAQLITGLASFLIAGFGLLILHILKMNKGWMKGISMCLAALCFILPALLIYQSYRPFLKADEGMPEHQDKYTTQGSLYTRQPDNRLMENGAFVWQYVAMDELKEEWPKRSTLALDGNTSKGSLLLPTLVRYLTSKHLRKDAAGLSQLSTEDIRAIESGIANYRYLHPNLMTRIYQICWEVHVYLIGGNPQMNSVGQRLVYWHAGWNVFRKNPWYGTGCGDLADSYEPVYQRDFPFIDIPNRHRAHNQYLSILIATGIPGLLLFAAIWLHALFFGGRKHYLWPAFWIIATVSMLTEDTLETQAGVTFVLFFFCYLSMLFPSRDTPAQG